MKKVSIVIGTLNHLEDCLKPCIDSIIKTTDLSETEVIVVANGCTDGTEAYMEGLIKEYGDSFKCLSFPKALGYARANNEGMAVAQGEHFILLNNDCQIMPSPKNAWVELLRAPYAQDPKIGMTGVRRQWESGLDFLIFFCVMFPKKIYDEIGPLDERFLIGAMEDVDYCVRVKEAGYKLRVVPDDPPRFENGRQVVNFPIYHAGEKTVWFLPEGRDAWEKNFLDNRAKLQAKYPHLMKSVTACISTKDRYNTTLPLAIMAVANQTKKVDKFLIFDDGEQKDLRKDSLYQNIFATLNNKGIQWEVVFGQRKGQVANHQIALQMAQTEWIWRLDDDNIPERDCLEKLIAVADEKTGAVGGHIPFPTMPTRRPRLASNKLEDIYLGMNVQWFQGNGVEEVEHLYSSFIYRKRAGAHGYCKELSIVGHREETIFTHEMKRAGWKLLYNPEAVTLHFREGTGGIRSFSGNKALWDSDEQVFRKKMEEWGVSPRPTKLMVLNNGLGDHIVFRSILPEIREKYGFNRLVLGCCFTDVFEDDKDLEIISIGDASVMANLDDFNIYKWMWDRGWSRSLQDAFRMMCLGEIPEPKKTPPKESFHSNGASSKISVPVLEEVAK